MQDFSHPLEKDENLNPKELELKVKRQEIHAFFLHPDIKIEDALLLINSFTKENNLNNMYIYMMCWKKK